MACDTTITGTPCNLTFDLLSFLDLDQCTCISAAVAILLIHIGVLTASYKKSERLYINLMNAKVSWLKVDADAQSEHKMMFLGLNRIQMNKKMTFLDLYRIHRSYPIVSGLLAAILVSCFGVMVYNAGTKKNENTPPNNLTCALAFFEIKTGKRKILTFRRERLISRFSEAIDQLNVYLKKSTNA